MRATRTPLPARARTAADDRTLPLPGEDGAAPPARELGLPSHIPLFGPYRDLRLLGSGGMGAVYRAVESGLERPVALKLLRRADARAMERFVQEARAQARLRHPHVGEVYGAGEIDGQPYIAMRLIEGRSLSELSPSLALEERIRVLAVSAEAVHEAHRQGLVHRDLKPSNILVERDPDGPLRPFVVDFGIVRDETVPGMTTDGELLGTPAYMAPEQLGGVDEPVDRRVDVYALGAILYELLAGRPPFGPVTRLADLVERAEQDPIPPRKLDPRIPADLETIALTCLEREPQRRYPSARAVAEELRRYLDGEPILARPLPGWKRLWRRLRRKPLAAALAVTACVAVVGPVTVGIHGRWETAREAQLAQRFGLAARDAEWLLRVARMSPIHSLEREEAQVRERLDQVREWMEEGGSVAQAPGHYALGRGLLALGRLSEAREHLEAAWEAGLREPEVAWALGVTLSAHYRRALDELRGTGDPRLRAAREDEIREAYREPVLRLLEASRGSELHAPEYLEGLVALHEGQWEEGLRKAEAAAERIPWLWEAHLLSGELRLGQARQLRESADLVASTAAIEQALAAFDRAVSIAPSDFEAHLGRCNAWIELLLTRHLAGDRRPDALTAATEACGSALQIRPGHPEATSRIAVAYRLDGSFLSGQGEDPSATFARAEKIARGSVADAPDSAAARESLGALLVESGRAAFLRGEDPRPRLQEALEHLEEAVRLEPERASAHDWVGSGLRLRAWFEWSRGLDPLPAWESAVAALERAAEIGDGSTFFLSSLADVHATRANYLVAHGRDADDDIERAIGIFGDCLARSPNDAGTLAGLGTAHFIRAEGLLLRGEDPREDALRSAELEERASGLAPGDAYPPFAKGYALLLAGSWELEQGRSPRSLAEASRESLRASIAINPSSAHAHTQLANAWWLLAAADAGAGRDPEPSLRAAATEVAQAIALDPTFADAYLASARLGRLRSTLAGEDPTAALQAAAADARQATVLNPGDSRGWLELAEALSRLPQPSEDTARDKEEAIRKALGKALELNPRLHRAQRLREQLGLG